MAKTWPTPRQKRTGSHRNDVFARSDAIAARRVIRDCHLALKDLEGAQSESVWRLRWITEITLLRAVGHVLRNVDGKRSPFLKAAIKEIFEETKQHRSVNSVFFDFIENERNSILKEYRIAESLIRSLNENEQFGINRHILFRDRVVDQSRLIHEAIRWWEGVLNDVETRADALLRDSNRTKRMAKKLGNQARRRRGDAAARP